MLLREQFGAGGLASVTESFRPWPAWRVRESSLLTWPSRPEDPLIEIISVPELFFRGWSSVPESFLLGEASVPRPFLNAFASVPESFLLGIASLSMPFCNAFISVPESFLFSKASVQAFFLNALVSVPESFLLSKASVPGFFLNAFISVPTSFLVGEASVPGPFFNTLSSILESILFGVNASLELLSSISFLSCFELTSLSEHFWPAIILSFSTEEFFGILTTHDVASAFPTVASTKEHPRISMTVAPAPFVAPFPELRRNASEQCFY